MGTNKSHLVAGQPIKFETVKQNFGNGYNPQLGMFSCPKSGIYFFTFTLMCYRGQETETKLVVNGVPVAYSYSSGTYSLYNTATQSVVVPLHPGDRVSVQFYDRHNALYGDEWSTFTGFMIREM